MHEAVDGRQRHGLVGEDLAPFAERLVGRDQHRAAFVARGDQLEQHAGFRLVLADVSEVVEDEQMVLVEFGNGAFERQFLPRHLQSLNKIGRAHEQHAPAVFDERQTDGRRQMAFAATGRAEHQDVVVVPSRMITLILGARPFSWHVRF